ncbi:3-keto-disaccharide hydrolase [Dyadobacter sp. OTU695]|uniref:3-keto-disaccharide hydrolase n=1 Tax=Dyadobacter sp. OTU695 TaxID=3043860 RepID=UPI00313B3874
MIKKLSFLLLTLSVSISVNAQKPADKEEWQSLFNGKDLTGWDVKIAGHKVNDNYKNTFLVEDNMIRVNYKEYDKFTTEYGHMYYNKPYSHYKIRLQYRFTGNQVPGGASWNVRNSGIMLHSQSAASLGLDQDFPISLEMQYLGGLNAGERNTGNLCTPGTIVDIDGKLAEAHCINSSSKTYNGDQWVDAEAIVLGDSIVYHLIGGDTVLVYTNPRIGGGYVGKNHTFKDGKVGSESEWIKKDGTKLGSGYIALQAESHPIDFRNIQLLNLKGCMDPKASNYKSYYVAADNSACTYKKK